METAHLAVAPRCLRWPSQMAPHLLLISGSRNSAVSVIAQCVVHSVLLSTASISHFLCPLVMPSCEKNKKAPRTANSAITS